MQKKLPLIVLLTIVLFLPFILGAEGDAEKIALANSCLKDKIDQKKCEFLSIEDKIFSVLAINECNSELRDESFENECWPSGNCETLTTAKAILALEKNTNTNKAEDWLISQNATASTMQWFLQIDSIEETLCTITYGGSSYTTTINQDKTVDSGAGGCLSVDDTGFWLEIDASRSLGCYTREYEVSCDKGFTTNLLFQKPGSSTIHVSDITSSAAEDGTTNETVDAYCTLKDGSCDYQSTLWAALALDAVDENIKSYLPYLITFADDQENQRYLPHAFLYILTGSDDFRNTLLLKQKENKYWSESGDRYYDTAVALYPFQFEDPFEKQNAITWLLDSQDADGCWQGNIRNTAFLLATLGEGQKNEDPGDGLTTKNECLNEGFSCLSGARCLEAGGNVLNFQCETSFKCCSVEEKEETCSDIGGEICSGSNICSGGRTERADDLRLGELCCVSGTCEEIKQEKDKCELVRGTCQTACGAGEEELSFDCTFSGDVCCYAGEEPETGGSKVWIWVLVMLIILTVLAIIFREKLKIFWIKIKSKSGKGPAAPGASSGSGRGPPPTRYAPGLRRRPINRRAPPFRKPNNGSSKELDNVLKKLKDIGK